MSYVTVMPAFPRSGWMVAHREGCMITHTRLDRASSHDKEAARAEVEAMFPNHVICFAGDPIPDQKIS